MAKPETKMSCARARALFEAYLDGDVAARRVTRLRAHVDTCFECREELAHATRVRVALRALPQKQMSEAATVALFERLRRLAESGAGGVADAAAHATGGAQPSRGTPAHGDRSSPHPMRGSRAQAPVGIGRRLRAWIAGVPAWRPALVGAGVVGIVLALMVMARPKPQQISPQELAQAETQIRWVMAHLGDISRRTGTTVRDEVIEARVVKPTTQAVETALERNTTQ